LGTVGSTDGLVLGIAVLLDELLLLVYQDVVFGAGSSQVVFRFGCLNPISGFLRA